MRWTVNWNECSKLGVTSKGKILNLDKNMFYPDHVVYLCLFVQMWLYVVLLGCVWVCESYPNGQVSSSCSDMIPSHGTGAQTSAAPYTIKADGSSYKEGDTITGKT